MKEDLEKIIKYNIYLETEKIRLAKVEIRKLRDLLSTYEYDEEKLELMADYQEILLDDNADLEEKRIAYINVLQLIKQINNIEMIEEINKQINQERKKISESKFQIRSLGKQLNNYYNNSKSRTRSKTYYRNQKI